MQIRRSRWQDFVPRGMVQLQPGYQPCNERRLSCCASIANDKSASNNSLREFFFGKLFFPFLFSRTERTRFVWCGLRVERHVDQKKQVARLVPCGIWSSCNRDASLATICTCRVRRRLHTTSRPATTVSGNSFSVNYFFLFSFLSERERVSVVADCASNDMRISRSRWQDLCLVVYGPAATGMPVLQLYALVVLRVDCTRQVGQQQ